MIHEVNRTQSPFNDNNTPRISNVSKEQRAAGVAKTRTMAELFKETNPYPVSPQQQTDSLRIAHKVEAGTFDKTEVIERMRAANKAWVASELERVPLDFSGEQAPGRAPMQHVDPAESVTLAAERSLEETYVLGLALDFVNFEAERRSA